jgi:ribosome recycling factor
MAKKVGKIEEEAKIQVRNVRRDAMTAVKKDKTMDEDTQKDAEEEVQKLTDKYAEKIEAMAKAKEKEVLNK